MKQCNRRRTVFVGLLAIGIWWHYRIPEPTLLSFRVGQTFEEVVRNSTYPATERANLPADHPEQSGVIWVTEPAVIIRFDDLRHGFTLPPTKFAVLGFQDNRALTLSTSPMLEKLPFDDALAIVEDLQNQFQAGGWLLYETDGSAWFDLTPEGRNRLFTHLLEHDMWTINLYVPQKYGMTFRLWCAQGCAKRKPPYRFMIDVGVGTDTHTWKKGDPKFRDESTPALAGPASR